MPDRDCTAVDVHNFRIPAHFLVHSAGLRGEGFVGFHKVEVFWFPTGFFQRLARGIDGADAHDRRVETCRGIGGDARQRGDAALFGVIRAHQQGTGCTVVQARGVGRSDRAVFGKGRAQLLHGFHRGPMADVFVLIDDSLAFAGFDRVGDDLIREFASFLRGLGLVLRSDGEFILLVAGNLPFFGDVFGGLAHVVAVERIPQTVTDHRVDELQIAHLLTRTQVLRVGAEGHVLLTASGDDVRIPQLDVLGRQCHGAQARAADLVDAPSGAFFRQARIDMRLTRGVLALGGGQHLPQNGLRDFGWVDPGAGHQFF